MTSLKAPTSHYYCTRRQAAKAPLDILSCPISWALFSVEKFQAILELQTAIPTSIIPSKHAGSIKFDVKRLENKLFLCCDYWRIGINLIIAILKHKRNRKFDFFSVGSILFFNSWTLKVIFSLVAPPLVKILLLVFIRWNKNRSYTEKVKYPPYINVFLPNTLFDFHHVKKKHLHCWEIKLVLK